MQFDFLGCPPLCKMFCLYGNEIDENGCKLCRCKPRSKQVIFYLSIYYSTSSEMKENAKLCFNITTLKVDTILHYKRLLNFLG